jgi:hypothetical protein
VTSVFDDFDALEKIAVNLFYGWGYNFYRLENQLRADDLTVRAKVGWLLGQARDAVDRAESAWRRERIPAPTREKPRPDPEAVEIALRLESLSREIGGLDGQIRAQPVPEADRMTSRYRREAETLHRLLQCDLTLVGAAEAFRRMLEEADAAAIVARERELQAGLRTLTRTLRERQGILQV